MFLQLYYVIKRELRSRILCIGKLHTVAARMGLQLSLLQRDCHLEAAHMGKLQEIKWSKSAVMSDVRLHV